MSRSRNRHLPAFIATICSTILVGVGGCVSPVPQQERVQSTNPSPVASSPSPVVTSPSPVATSPSPVVTSPLIPSPVTTSPTPPEVTEKSLNLYWLKDTGTKLELVPSPVRVQAGDKPNNLLQAVFRALLDGSNNSNLATAIPDGTKLRSLEVKADGVHINLSQEFTSGGGSASMSGRLGQVVYTATALDPNASVWISVEGKKLEVLGGEGLEVEQPLTRQKFREDFDF